MRSCKRKSITPLCAFLLFLNGMATPTARSAETDSASLPGFIERSSHIAIDPIATLAVHDNGRLKPFETLARETVLFISGKYRPLGLKSIQAYLGIVIDRAADSLDLIEIRDPDLRSTLGFARERRHVSARELEQSKIESMARPLMAKQEKNSRSMTPTEKKILETYQQLQAFKFVASGQHFLRAVDFSFLSGTSGHGSAAATTSNSIPSLAMAFLERLRELNPGPIPEATERLVLASQAQTMPELFQHSVGNLSLEVSFYRLRPFFWAALLYFLIALSFLVPTLRNAFGAKRLSWLLALPMFFHAAGFACRVMITGFAPVTNMYGTMLWVALGVSLFSSVLLFLYKNYTQVGMLILGSSLILFLTENMPLILSPDMDPIVAVLRSNYWLTIHVLTITISYAAFTTAMLIGNIAVIRDMLRPGDTAFIQGYAHSAYRMMQLGVFLLSAGIILGGIWADYSWGRFWGWDPKETWALIADLGFIAILHARFVGWLRDYGLLAAAPVAYLLVIMAWYGVNFILATGLHSYGFSSGGAMMVSVFVGVQLTILVAALILRRARQMKAQTKTGSKSV